MGAGFCENLKSAYFTNAVYLKDIHAAGVDLLGAEGQLFAEGYEMRRPDNAGAGGSPQRSFLRSRANSIEGGTTEVMKNILGERVLGLPGDARADRDLPWSQVTAVECSVPTATLIVADIERVSDESTNPRFRANCASAMDAVEMAILDSARNTPPRSIRAQDNDAVEPRRTIHRHDAGDHRDRG